MKKAYIIYKFHNQEQKKLRKHLESIDEAVRNCGLDTFIFFRDVQHWQSSENEDIKAVFDRAYEEFQKCDLVIVDASQGSDGIFYELGWARPLNKEVIGIYRNWVDPFIEQAITNKMIQYSSYEELKEKLKRGKISCISFSKK